MGPNWNIESEDLPVVRSSTINIASSSKLTSQAIQMIDRVGYVMFQTEETT